MPKNNDFVVSADRVYGGTHTRLVKYLGTDKCVVVPDSVDIVDLSAFSGKEIDSIECTVNWNGKLPDAFWGLQGGDLSVKKLIIHSARKTVTVDLDKMREIFPHLDEIQMPCTPGKDEIKKVYFRDSPRSFYDIHMRRMEYIEKRQIKLTVCKPLIVIRESGGLGIWDFGSDSTSVISEPDVRLELVQPEIAKNRPCGTSNTWAKDSTVMLNLCGYLIAYKQCDAEIQKDNDAWIKKHARTLFNRVLRNAKKYPSTYDGEDVNAVMKMINMCVACGIEFTPDAYEDFLALAEEKGDTSLKATLMTEYSAHYDLDKMRQKKESRELQRLIDPNAVKFLREDWNIEKTRSRMLWGEQEEVSLKRYKNASAACIVIPSAIGKDVITQIKQDVLRKRKDGIKENPVKTVVFSDESRIEKIPACCFNMLDTLESVHLPDSILELGERAFFGDGNLREINFPRNLLSIGASCFSSSGLPADLIIPESVQYIGNSAFYSSVCENVEILGNPFINNGAFVRCTMKRFAAANLKSLSASVIAHNEKLIEVHIPNVKAIHSGNMCQCASLKEIHLSPDLEYVGDGVLWGCNNLKWIVFPKGSDLSRLKALFAREVREKIVVETA